MVLKVKDGTRSGVGLCTTCRYSHIIKGASESQQVTLCSQMSGTGQVPFAVVECNDYQNKAQTSLSDMRETAWVLSTDKTKRFGFQTPKEWRKNREFGEDGLDDLKVPIGL